MESTPKRRNKTAVPRWKKVAVGFAATAAIGATLPYPAGEKVVEAVDKVERHRIAT